MWLPLALLLAPARAGCPGFTQQKNRGLGNCLEGCQQNVTAAIAADSSAPVLMLAAAAATVEGLPTLAGTSGGATFQALWEEAKQQTANRSAVDPREAAGGASGAAAVDGGVAGEEEPVPERGDRPNLLLMVADDLAASDLTSYRKQGVGGLVHGLTPNLDGIARKGALFMQAHSVAPLCTPARFALLTGVQPACGLLEEGAPPQSTAAPPPLVSGETYLAPHHRTLPHKLRRLGYTTGLVGLWHLGTPESNAGKKLSRQVPNAQCPMPNAKCQMPNAQCPMPGASAPMCYRCARLRRPSGRSRRGAR